MTLLHLLDGFRHWVAVWTGTSNVSGDQYGFLSGAGSDITELAVIGGLVSVYRRHNCEVKGCWRLGRHATAAGHHVCRVHHPDGHLTGEDVIRAHDEARRAG